MKTRFKAALSLILAALLTLAACGQTSGGAPAQSDFTSETDTETAAVTEPEYVFPSLDMKGETFTMLNTPQTYSFYSTLDVENATGDALDDAVYARNRAVEEKYNVKLFSNEDYSLQKAATALQTAVLAQDDVYDVAFIRDSWLTASLTDGHLVDLQSYPEFQFEEKWWDSAAIKSTRIGAKAPIHYAFTDASLVDFEGTVIVFFNEDMMKNLDLDAPYKLVLDGKWTLDELGKYMKAGANLNGAAGYAWDVNATTTYGLVSYEHCTDALIIGSMQDFYVKDSSGQPKLATSGDKFYTVATKVVNMLIKDGEYLFLNGNTEPNSHYEMALKNNRSLMIIAQLKAANRYRDMEAAYGIVPIPKYNEAQETYRNTRSYTYVMCVPVTNQNVKSAGIIMDALSYLTYKDVIPAFYDGRLSAKQLRNDESVAMLNIIRETRYYDIGQAYGWSETIKKVFRSAVTAKSTDVASGVASVQPAIEASIAAVMAKLN